MNGFVEDEPRSRLRRRALFLVLIIPLLLTTSCQFRPIPLGGAGGVTVPGEATLRNVRFEVRCKVCTVVYQAGHDGGTTEGEGSWGRSINVNPRQVHAVSLNVTTEFNGAIYAARILIDGRVVAEEEAGSGRGLSDPIHISAVVS